MTEKYKIPPPFSFHTFLGIKRLLIVLNMLSCLFFVFQNSVWRIVPQTDIWIKVYFTMVSAFYNVQLFDSYSKVYCQ